LPSCYRTEKLLPIPAATSDVMFRTTNIWARDKKGWEPLIPKFDDLKSMMLNVMVKAFLSMMIAFVQFPRKNGR
jgi:hypothetical protein